MFAVDGSQTVDDKEFAAMVRFTEQAVSLQTVSPQMSNIGLIIYGADGTSKVPLHLSDGITNVAVQKAIKGSLKVGGRREIDKVLSLILKEFKTQSKRDNVGKLAILLMTGEDESIGKPMFKDIANGFEAEGVKLVIVKIGKPLREQSLDEMGRNIIKDVKNIALPSDLKDAIGSIEKATADVSRKFFLR